MGALFLGNMEAAINQDILKKHKITAVLTVAAKMKINYGKNIVQYHEIIEILDTPKSQLSEYFT